VNNDVIGVLIDLGWVAESESEDRGQIACGIAKMLFDLAASHRR